MDTRHLNLMDKSDDPEDADGNRPNISIWIEDRDDGSRVVAVAIKSLWGQPARYIDLVADEARELACLLQDAAGGC